MKSRHITYLLSDYLENQLHDSTRQQVEEHLSSCAKCQAKLEELKKYKELVAQIQPHSAPGDIRKKVMEKIDAGYKMQDAGYRMEHGTWNIEHGTSKKLITGHWSLVTVSAAAIIILLILAVPKEIFLPTTISTDVVAVIQKKGKGAVTVGGVMKNGGEKIRGTEEQRSDDWAMVDWAMVDWAMVDFRLKKVLELIDEVEGEVMSVKLNSTGESYSHLVVGMSKGNYKIFSEEYNQMGMGEPIPSKAGFSMSNKVLVNLFPIKRRFFVHDYNEDGFDDMVLHYTSGRNEGKWFIALNNHMGNFYPALVIEMDSLPLASGMTDSTITFSGDFNGDGVTDYGVKYLSGEFISQFHLTLSMDEGLYASTVPFRFGKGLMAWQGNYTHYFGDFNADGLTDMLTKEGNGDVLGNWYLMLNNGKNGFGSSTQVRFGRSNYFTSN
ncbi:MAG: zf-HC2 domain-containing protein [Bacteroidota bacterium]|nr:zf-HC2 domain-containing protein [Bacteroidota bacterium]